MNEARCRKSILCEFEENRNLPDAIIEVCIHCGRKVIYHKIEGRIDDARYLRMHIRDTLQPYGRTGKLFDQVWGKTAREAMRTAKHFLKNKVDPKKQKEMREELKQRRLFLRRQALLGSANASLARGSKDIERSLPKRVKKTFRI